MTSYIQQAAAAPQPTHHNPIFLIRHSERFDEVLHHNDYDNYTKNKRSFGSNQPRQQHEHPMKDKIEVHFDPTLNPNTKQKFHHASSSSLDSLTAEDHHELLPFPHLYPNYRHDRCLLSSQCDPPITRQGVRIAKQAGRTIRSFLGQYHQQHYAIEPQQIADESYQASSGNNLNIIKVRLYSSRLQRCIQTAYVIARKCNVRTIYIATGLALTAQAVDDIGGDQFDFLSFEEIAILCHDMKIIDCDTGRVYYGPDYAPAPNEIRVDQVPCLINRRQWLYAFEDIKNHPIEDEINTYKVVVIHRETIRNLLPFYDRCRLPYCAIAQCKVGAVNNPLDEREVNEAMRRKLYPIKLKRIFKPDGELLREVEHPPPKRVEERPRSPNSENRDCKVQ